MPLILPFYLFFLTVVFVVIPSVAAIILRFALHRHLLFLEERVRRLINRGERGNQPDIVINLEARFREASRDLEHVNTVALIDQVYSQEKIWLFSCEQIEYFCRILPNLLLAFGLLGTFLGITVNLSELSQTISQTSTSDVSSLVQELEKPLQGMGIAFTTSLTGLFFSAILTLFNFIKNTSLAKYKLISSLEDYLDNIYQPTIPGHTRIDKAVDRLVFEFQGFLSRFGLTVREAVEKPLGDKIQQIVDANKEANELAMRVYSGFQASSGTISRSVGDFKEAVVYMKKYGEIFKEAAQIFENSQFAQTLSKATTDLANTQEKFSHSTSKLTGAIATIEVVANELQSCSQKLVQLGEEIGSINQTSIQVLELHRSSQQSLSEIIPQLQQGAESYQTTAITVDNLQKQIADSFDSWSSVQIYLTQLVSHLNNYTEQVNLEVQTLGDRLVGSMSDQEASHKTQIQAVLEHTSNVQVYLPRLVENLNNYTEGVDLSIRSLGDRLIESMSEQKEINKTQLQGVVEHIQQCITHLNDTKHENYRLARLIESQALKRREDKTDVKELHKGWNKQ